MKEDNFVDSYIRQREIEAQLEDQHKKQTFEFAKEDMRLTLD